MPRKAVVVRARAPPYRLTRLDRLGRYLGEQGWLFDRTCRVVRERAGGRMESVYPIQPGVSALG
jgi:hypothetical protein